MLSHLLRRPVLSTFLAPHRLLRHKSTVTIVPSEVGQRQLAQPLAFVAVKGWEKDGITGWMEWAQLAAKGGYTSFLVEIDPTVSNNSSDSSALLDDLSAEFSSIMTSPDHGTPFPPILISSSLSTLVSQTYVSSHPLSALVLHSPSSPLTAHSLHPSTFPTPLLEFTYEPNFPTCVMREAGDLSEPTRVEVERGGEDFGDVHTLVGGKGEEGYRELMRWMDESGL